ncbi:PREDICTED: protein PRRC2C-like, partial [Elephantulus edwardii]|uniref:protein PRRC2C-like n=1 Tax=Elephantulus edwardii TaxID=28737 RepID=UPI0003F0B0B1
GTYTTSSLSTKSTTTSDPPNICKVKPQQLQTSSLPSASHFSQLSCMPSLIAQQQQSPQVYVSQSAAVTQMPAFYVDTTHIFNTQHARLAPPSLAQQQGFQPGLSQLGGCNSVVHTNNNISKSQPAFMQSSLTQPSMVLSGTAIHNFPAVQHQELAKAQSGLAFQQTSNTQPIPILYEHQLGQASGLGGSQLIDTHLLQSLTRPAQVSQPFRGLIPAGTQHSMIAAPGKMSEMELKAFGSGIDIKPGTPPISGRSTTPTSSPFRATSTSPNSQSSKMNSIVYQKQFQSAPATVR